MLASEALTIGLVVGTLVEVVFGGAGGGGGCFTDEPGFYCLREVNWSLGWFVMWQLEHPHAQEPDAAHAKV